MNKDSQLGAENGSKALASLRGKWKLKILVAMLPGSIRLSELERLVPEATKKMLIDSLHSLEASGIVLRRDFDEPLRHVEYEIVSPMRDATETLLGCLAEWGEILGRGK